MSRVSGLILIALLFSFLFAISVQKACVAQDEQNFSDEFLGSVLDSRWVVVNPAGGSIFDLTSKPGYLTISTSSPPDRDLWEEVNLYAPRIMQTVSSDFSIETKLLGNFDTHVQSAGIVLWQDESNYLRLERAFRYGFHEIIFCGMINGVYSTIAPETVDPGALIHVSNINPTYLKLRRIGVNYSGYYSADGAEWVFLANITLNSSYSVSAGLYNVIRWAPAFSVGFDYLRITRTIFVPDYFLTIQEAINAASNGDTVFVRNGVYSEHLTVNKTLTLVGEDRNLTIIDGSGNGEIVNIQANNVYVGNFTLQNAGMGAYGAVWVQGCSNAVICNNTMIDNRHGVGVWAGALNATVLSNLIYNRQPSYADGIRLGLSSGHLVTGNKVINESAGIGLDWASNNVVQNNTVVNSYIGIGAGNPSYSNVFSENTIANNNYGFRTTIYDSKFFHNNIINNSVQVSFYSSGYSNIWDNGYLSGGNYWSDYNGEDADSDGIGDSPYIIDANNQDNYPLVNPWAPPDIAVTNVTVSKTIIGQGYTLRINATVQNQGNKAEIFNVTEYVNLTAVPIFWHIILKGGNTIVIQFIWKTTFLARGVYELAVVASRPEGEVDRLDNIFIFGNIQVTKKGDINGDGDVDVLDLITIANSMGSKPGQPGWNPNADAKEDFRISVLDLIVVVAYLGT